MALKQARLKRFTTHTKALNSAKDLKKELNVGEEVEDKPVGKLALPTSPTAGEFTANAADTS